MPQLDLYIWFININLIFFTFIFLYFYLIFFFLVNIVRVLYLKKYYFNYMNFLNFFIIKYNYISENGLFFLTFSKLITTKYLIFLKFSFLFNFFFSYNCYILNSIMFNVLSMKTINLYFFKKIILK